MARAHEGYDIVTIVDSERSVKKKRAPVLSSLLFRLLQIVRPVDAQVRQTRRHHIPSAVALGGALHRGTIRRRATVEGESYRKRFSSAADRHSRHRAGSATRAQLCPGLEKGAADTDSSTVAPLRIALVASFCAAALSLLYFRVRYPGLFLSALRPRLDDTVASDFRHDAVVFTDIHTPSGICHSDLHAGSPALGRRGLVVREWRSRLTKRPDRLNIVNTGGNFYLGAPERTADISRKLDNPEVSPDETAGPDETIRRARRRD